MKLSRNKLHSMTKYLQQASHWPVVSSCVWLDTLAGLPSRFEDQSLQLAEHGGFRVQEYHLATA